MVCARNARGIRESYYYNNANKMNRRPDISLHDELYTTHIYTINIIITIIIIIVVAITISIFIIIVIILVGVLRY